MFKKLALLALGAVSVSAFGQASAWQDPSTMTYTEAKQAVMTRAIGSINAGDAYLLSNILDRAPSNVSTALAFALAHNHWQARIIAEELALSRYPMDRTSYTTTVTNPDGTITTTTTTTTAYDTEYAVNMRPMRIVMENMALRDMSYDQALDIITANVTTAEATQLRDWWWNKATERERDIIVRSLKANAKLGDTIYSSTVHR
ncbi:MAG: hypothetical protein ACAH95_07185 [Fimbriimonas sp.]